MLRTYNTTRAVFGQNFILTKHKHTNTCLQVRIQDFKLGEGGALKKIAPSGGRPENIWGISCEKSRFYAKKSYFFQLWGGGGGGWRLDPPLVLPYIFTSFKVLTPFQSVPSGTVGSGLSD